jgi:hypothetical protein
MCSQCSFRQFDMIAKYDTTKRFSIKITDRPECTFSDVTKFFAHKNYYEMSFCFISLSLSRKRFIDLIGSFRSVLTHVLLQ